MVRQGNLLRVAPLAQLEQEREAAIARQKQQQQLAPLETRLIPVSYATATDLQPRVRELLTERGSVSVDERTNMLIVRDIIGQLDNGMRYFIRENPYPAGRADLRLVVKVGSLLEDDDLVEMVNYLIFRIQRSSISQGKNLLLIQRGIEISNLITNGSTAGVLKAFSHHQRTC